MKDTRQRWKVGENEVEDNVNRHFRTLRCNESLADDSSLPAFQFVVA